MTTTKISRRAWSTIKDPFPVGMTLNDRTYVATPERIATYVMALGVRDNLWYSANSRYGEPICPPGLLCIEPVRFPDFPGYGHRVVLNTRCEWELYKPMRPGQTLTLKCRVSDRWLKRGKEHITFEMPVADERGELVSLCRFSEAMLDPPVYDPPLPSRDHETGRIVSCAAGPELGTLARDFTLDMVKGIAGPVNDWHTNRDKARERGLEDVLVTGPHFVAHIMELLTRVFGRGFAEGGRMRVNALRPVLVDQRITARLFEHRRTLDADGVCRVEAMVWCEDDQGTKTFAGMASARLPDGEPMPVTDLAD